MALTLIYIDRFGKTHPDAYFKIRNISANYKPLTAETSSAGADDGTIHVDVFHNLASRTSNKDIIETLHIPVTEFTSRDLRTLSTLRNAMYTFLKTLDKFADAEDI